jgi:hypothetical protein
MPEGRCRLYGGFGTAFKDYMAKSESTGTFWHQRLVHVPGVTVCKDDLPYAKLEMGSGNKLADANLSSDLQMRREEYAGKNAPPCKSAITWRRFQGHHTA